MKSKYSHKLNNANILLGIHGAFKLVIILILFVVLYTSIWIKEKYLIFIKVSTYAQIFMFLTLSMVILVLNNPRQMDICSTFINYFYLVVSILQIGIIVIELYFLIQNLKNFLDIFHECPYCRTYKDIIDLEYKRTCLYYNEDNNNELPFKYICYYNSENEYLNSFCDGLLCKKNKNKNEINSDIKCYRNVIKENIKFPPDNEFYSKELELINKYKSSNLYTCFRKNKIYKNDNIFNKKCPDSNPVKKMIIFIYLDLILHLFIDFLFIYELITIKNIKEIYMELCNQATIIPINILSNEDYSNTNNKQTYNTDNRNSTGFPSYQIQRDNSQTIIIIPGYKNSEIEEIKSEYNEHENNITNINRSNDSQINQYDDIIVHYDPNEDDDNKADDKTENNGVINRKAKIFNLKKNYKKNINDEENNKINNLNDDIHKINDNQNKVVLDIDNEDDQYDINRKNFIIKKNKKKSDIKNKGNKLNDKNLNKNKNNIFIDINVNNKDDIKKTQNKKKQILNNDIQNKEQNSLKNKSYSSNDNDSLNPLKEQKNKIPLNSNKNINKKLIKNKSGTNNIGINNNKAQNQKELPENNLKNNDAKNDNEDKIINNDKNINHSTLKKDLIKNHKNKNKNNLTKEGKENIENSKNKVIKDKENINNNIDNIEVKDEKVKNTKNLLNNIHIKSEIFSENEELYGNDKNIAKMSE